MRVSEPGIYMVHGKSAWTRRVLVHERLRARDIHGPWEICVVNARQANLWSMMSPATPMEHERTTVHASRIWRPSRSELRLADRTMSP
jgi:hypothetical protein